MKLTKKLEQEVKQAYLEYWESYFTGQLRKFSSLLDDDYKLIGTSEIEVINSKLDALIWLKHSVKEIKGKTEFRNRKIKISPVDDHILVNELADVYIIVNREWKFYSRIRISTFLRQTKNKWKVVQQHGSLPDARTGKGETVSFDSLSKENLKLRDAVKRRTAELENKTRELEIESALERVRTVAMGMKKPEDMLDICRTISSQMAQLGVKEIRNVQTAIFYEARGTYMNYEYYTKHNKTFVTDVNYRSHQVQRTFAKKMMRGDNEQVSFKGKKLRDWYDYQKSTNQFADKYLLKAESLNYYWFSLGPVALGLSTYYPIAQEEADLFQRFLKVFELAYRRYLDIEIAETQAREAKIEASLERVRAITMAMRDSSELGGLIYKLYGELTKLDAKLDRCFIMIVNPENKGITWWLAGKEGLLAENGFFVPMNEHPSHLMYLDRWKKRKKKWQYLFEGKEKKDCDRYLFSKTELARLPEFIKKDMASVKKIHLSGSSDQFGSIVTGSFEPLSEEQQDVISRFAVAFNQAYIRFLDLQKAEAQAREAQIEASLERVRSRTMGMQKSEELKDVIRVVNEQFLQLNINVDHAGFIMDYKERDDMHIWLADPQEVPSQLTIPYFDSPHWNSFVDAKKKGLDFFTNHLDFEQKNKFYRYLFKLFPVSDNAKKYYSNCPGLAISTVLLENIGLYIENFSGTPYTDAENAILIRFGKVFEQAYTRFLDLQKAEFQTHQAKIETALEKVRARALAMQQPEELTEVAQVMRYEMGLLGVEELETSSIYIHEENADQAECWYAIKDIRDPEKKLVADHFVLNLHDTWVGRQMFDFYHSTEKQISIPMRGVNRKEWINYCSDRSKLLDGFYGDVIPERTYHLYKFSNGTIGAATPGNISAESWDLLQRAASVFSLAYSRFKDLTQARTDLQRLKEEKQRAETALAELQTTQKQLIQAEKMASLGELTAGIAHEIQNPLNFVNNFSEINTELSEELSEAAQKGDLQVVILLANDIRSNQEKISDHGKRADAIVKGMLQHSRSSSGIKEPTNINALGDEYLRLAYHGLRAKDKSFNSTIKTDFDQSIGNINIIPQDIGRVLLNLINNAFYAVNEKKKQIGEGYEPEVTVTTRLGNNQKNEPISQLANWVMISVRDNGNGIPDTIRNKIFQPFFTTKPTGQGTGLGLSLSYDIVKAHGGELKVETKEGEGTEFIIQLPVA